MPEKFITLSKKFDEIARLLSGEGSLNYVVSFGIFYSKDSAGKNLEEIVSKAIGHPVKIEDPAKWTAERAVDLMRERFSYEGDYGAHPSLSYFSSVGFRDELNKLLIEARSLLDKSDLIVGFNLVEGSPFEGGFPWEFSFCAEIGKDAYVWIGSSSD